MAASGMRVPSLNDNSGRNSPRLCYTGRLTRCHRKRALFRADVTQEQRHELAPMLWPGFIQTLLIAVALRIPWRPEINTLKHAIQPSWTERSPIPFLETSLRFKTCATRCSSFSDQMKLRRYDEPRLYLLDPPLVRLGGDTSPEEGDLS
ncbi:hypothetical protein BDZ89DRAFT_189863 [Hymenopellis radicata]|nr:hypothetical protein BDZ89DRAFT_189863 [Hymenopellis radicata]